MLNSNVNNIRFIITTSRHDTRRTRTFCKDLSYAIPRALKINRGKMSIEDIHSLALKCKCMRVIIVNTFRGNPGLMTFYSVGKNELIPLEPRLKIISVKMVFEIREAKRIKVEDAVIYCTEDSLNIASVLSELFSFKLFLNVNLNYFPVNFSIINLKSLGNDYFYLYFINSSQQIIGPIIKAKFV
ncbi:MAG: hypothetical protein NZ926_01140 [Candidatus Methanomethylicia archaeon]|nr:hypothetical protein [Candidatus Methanomethylicia archaeon]MCX8169035.1 hypothetical protein [Candidatus Methanomethylicia archaeon]MDW7988767.1 hypothetical protein [Nitrososphaerota archaeon]